MKADSDYTSWLLDASRVEKNQIKPPLFLLIYALYPVVAWLNIGPYEPR